MKLKIKKLREDAIIPKYMTKGSVGFDISAVERTVIQPHDMTMVKTGLAVQIPEGHEMTIRQRSGLSLKRHNYIVIGLGTIDNDYLGEIIVPIKNNERYFWEIERGDRIAQCIVSPIVQCEIEVVDELDETERGEDGFGSTGK